MMKNKAFFMVIIFVMATSGRAFSQTLAPQDFEKLRIMEDSLIATSDSMFDSFLPDLRVGYSERFVRQLVHALKIPNSWLYPFDSLSTIINIIKSDDSSFRIFNWEITPSNITKRYYGAIQLPGERLKLIGLNDYTEEVGKGAEDSILTGGKWFGALYYRIMSQEINGRKMYTMFGYNGSSSISNKKLLDAMYFEDNHVVFGAPIFGVSSHNFPGHRVNRFILEYKKVPGRAVGVGLSISGMGDRLRLIYRICNKLFLKYEITASMAGLPSTGRVGSPGRQAGDDRVNVSDAAGPSRPPDRALWAVRHRGDHENRCGGLPSRLSRACPRCGRSRASHLAGTTIVPAREPDGGSHHRAGHAVRSVRRQDGPDLRRREVRRADPGRRRTARMGLRESGRNNDGRGVPSEPRSRAAPSRQRPVRRPEDVPGSIRGLSRPFLLRRGPGARRSRFRVEKGSLRHP